MILHRNNTLVIPVYIRSSQHLHADLISRNKVLPDWHLNKGVARKLFNMLGQPEVDLMATSLSHQVPQYYSALLDEEALGVDVFTQTRLCVPKPGHDPINLEQDLSVQTDISVHCDNSLETQSTVVPQGNCTRSEEASQVTDQLEDGDGLGRQQLHPGNALWREDKVRRLAAFRQSRSEL